VIESTGAILMGRRTNEGRGPVSHRDYGGAWTGPYFVLTHEPPAVVPDWMTGTFIDEDIEAAVGRATEAAGSKDVVILGANLAKQCLQRDYLTRSSSTSPRCCWAMGCAFSRLPAANAYGSTRSSWSAPVH
jgi:dihydrofolate reductase